MFHIYIGSTTIYISCASHSNDICKFHVANSEKNGGPNTRTLSDSIKFLLPYVQPASVFNICQVGIEIYLRSKQFVFS
jgi:hypothetical protein